jgi:putative nucleotidyltransferase with HDIG domain
MNRRLVQIDVKDVRVGMYVSALDRPWLETSFLFQGFPVGDEEDMVELRRQCEYVYVDPEQTDSDIDVHALARPDGARAKGGTQDSGDQRVSAYTDISDLRRDLAEAQSQHDRACMLVREVMDNLQRGGKLDLRTAQKAVDPIVDSVIKSRSAMTWLVRMREESDYLYTHSVSTAIWATVMARHLGMPKEEIEAAGLGAMLLDVGKTRVPREILAKPAPLTPDEMVIARRHVEFGLDILKETENVSPDVIAMVETHHERHDGSGYPRGLSGQQIPVLGRIGGIVDYYDAVTSERPYAEALSSYDCLRSMNRLSGTAFQPEMVEQFIQSIGFFPPGTLVEMNDGSVAVVVAQNRRHRLKPEILLLLDPEHNLKRDFQLVDLQMQVRSAYTDEVLHIDKGLEPGSYGIDPAEYFLG